MNIHAAADSDTEEPRNSFEAYRYGHLSETVKLRTMG